MMEKSFVILSALVILVTLFCTPVCNAGVYGWNIGKISLEKGDADPGNSIWNKDKITANASNWYERYHTIIQVKIMASAEEGVNLTGVWSFSGGTGEDYKITWIGLIADLNGSGVYDSLNNVHASIMHPWNFRERFREYIRLDPWYVSTTYGENVLAAGESRNFLIAYSWNETFNAGETYSETVYSVSGIGQTTGNYYKENRKLQSLDCR